MAESAINWIAHNDDRMWGILATVNAKIKEDHAIDKAKIQDNCEGDHAKAPTFVRPRYLDTSEVLLMYQSFHAWKLVVTSPPSVFAPTKARQAARMLTSNLMCQSFDAWKLVVTSPPPVFFSRGSSRVNPKLASYVEETRVDQVPRPYLNGTSTGSGSTNTVWTPHNPDEFR